MMLTVADFVYMEPVPVAVQRTVKIVWFCMGSDVSVPLVPVHELPFVEVTMHESIRVVLHTTCTERPWCTRSGVTEKLIVGGGA